MAFDGWIEFDDTELINISRTSQLAEAMGVPAVWARPTDSSWIDTRLGGVDYDEIGEAPWYDPGVPASSEFAGIVPLSIRGLDDDAFASTVSQYTADGGHPGRGRTGTLDVVFNVAVVASSERGAAFGNRWLGRILRNGSTSSTVICGGIQMRYLSHAGTDAEIRHRNRVRMTRGVSVTRKSVNPGSHVWVATFTVVSADPYEYGPQRTLLSNLGAASPTGAVTSGTVDLVSSSCPTYDASPIYDPLYPALSAPPAPPNLIPDGWNFGPGTSFRRYWATVNPVEPSGFNFVPVVELAGTAEARMVRVSVWPSSATPTTQCGALFSVVVGYVPTTGAFFVDGEQRASYVKQTGLGILRRGDSLVFSPAGGPVEWASFNEEGSLRVTLDLPLSGGTPTGGGNLRAKLSLVEKTD